ncbi:hypothetical protein DFH09DRAFT_1334001 [Mycena vulgaris]|nr:hypothetical protein DFH09DRAFT_1334001 [Mycena vulgaris]
MSSVGLVRGTLADADAQRIASATFAVPRKADRAPCDSLFPISIYSFLFFLLSAVLLPFSHLRNAGLDSGWVESDG